MKFEVTDKEQDLLLELIEAEQKQIIHELHHTDSRDYRAMLRERLLNVEALLAKVHSSRLIPVDDVC
jgi:hypothetical protein